MAEFGLDEKDYSEIPIMLRTNNELFTLRFNRNRWTEAREKLPPRPDSDFEWDKNIDIVKLSREFEEKYLRLFGRKPKKTKIYSGWLDYD